MKIAATYDYFLRNDDGSRRVELSWHGGVKSLDKCWTSWTISTYCRKIAESQCKSMREREIAQSERFDLNRRLPATRNGKGFWVSWTLQHLFLLKDIPELRFKGGTSLSKVFRLIDRFSEDIDISIDSGALGFSGERDLASPKLSTTKWKALDQELREAITKEVHLNILPKLHARFERVLGKQTWTGSRALFTDRGHAVVVF
jgi:hypothetical protein